MNTFNIKEENILKRLQTKYQVTNVRYNIMTSNFIYYTKNNEKKHISLHSLVNLLAHEENHDVELYELLKSLNDSYFDNRIKEYFVDFYKEHNIPIPRDIYITSGFIEFITKSGEIFYLPYEDDIDITLQKATKFINI